MAVDLITLTDPRSAAAEAYRTLRTNLLFSSVDAAYRKIAVTSPSDHENKSVALANLAVTLAQAEHRTLIVDADLRRPSQHTLWGVDNKHGLTSMVLDEKVLQNPPIQQTSVNGLFILPSGALPATPADVLASRKMDEVIAKLATLADFILFDVPPVLAASDASVFSRKLDGLLLVLRAGSTRRDQIDAAKAQLDQVQAKIIGAVLTNAPKENNKVYGV